MAPPSKSYSHRAFLAALLTRGAVRIERPLVDGDLAVTLRTARQLGLEVTERGGGVYEARGPDGFSVPQGRLDVGNSGTTVRVLTSVAALVPGNVEFVGSFFERKRPIGPLVDALRQLNVNVREGPGKLVVEGGDLRAGNIRIRGDVSSQFITSLLMTLPLARVSGSTRESRVLVTTPLKSEPYIQMTEKVLSWFGIEVRRETHGGRMEFVVPAEQSYSPCTCVVPGDFSSAAFLLVAAAVVAGESDVVASNLDPRDPQGDKAVLDVLRTVGTRVDVNSDRKEVRVVKERGAQLAGFEYDFSNTPDLFPVLCVLATRCDGTSTFAGLEHLRYKECDRVAVMRRELGRMGASVTLEGDSLTVVGGTHLEGVAFNTEKDHRIVMAATIAALGANSVSTISEPEYARDSYPSFFDDLTSLGARVDGD
ncbi:MAG: 3-phosphoshikimate 1-carboxyvinyltransferase [Promethearchaeota archaeon]